MIAFGNKEHTTDKKMGVSVLLRLFISSNEVCNTAYPASILYKSIASRIRPVSYPVQTRYTRIILSVHLQGNNFVTFDLLYWSTLKEKNLLPWD